MLYRKTVSPVFYKAVPAAAARLVNTHHLFACATTRALSSTVSKMSEKGATTHASLEHRTGSDVVSFDEKDKLRTLDAGLTPDQVVVEYDEAETRRILRKIDYRLIPLLSVLYLLAYIDRSNLGNAKIAGMEDDLNLYGLRYNAALTVFFVPYALLEVPSNVSRAARA
jgi:hypothetical protein